jgi:large subunit ribosomal protein L30
MMKKTKQTKSENSTIKITQVGSSIGRGVKQIQTLNGLGLRRIGMVVELEATPEVLGMVRKVSHLVKFELLKV